jgi:hypothetical protein
MIMTDGYSKSLAVVMVMEAAEATYVHLAEAAAVADHHTVVVAIIVIHVANGIRRLLIVYF